MFVLSLSVVLLTGAVYAEVETANPPHCTNVTKGTDYVYHYRFDYPVAYIHPGVKEVYQPLYCTNPPAVAVASTIVCDWAAPPQVQFTLGDDYMHVVRQDPTGKFAGNAVIWTYQLCSHNHLLPEPYTSKKLNITRV
ncbi:uncharacterized protein LOC134748536 [Cydia strobilella]|uniref:uncharacterized protein LOC134748536 n=1 Tax=Cydia strobilella TaxID=1100964 RepID=UPI003006A53F